jgi:hypothetical protein
MTIKSMGQSQPMDRIQLIDLELRKKALKMMENGCSANCHRLLDHHATDGDLSLEGNLHPVDTHKLSAVIDHLSKPPVKMVH